MTPIELAFYGVAVPACVIVAYKRVVFARLWPNIPLFFAPIAAWFIVRAPDTASAIETGLKVATLFAMFVLFCHAGAWVEDRFGGRNRT